MKTFTLALAAGALFASTPVLAQSFSDTQRLQDAQNRVNSELSIYRQQVARPNQGRNASYRLQTARDRLDQSLSSLRVELDRYQSLVRNQNAYGQQAYRSGNDNYYDDPNYDPARDYREGNYQERQLAENDRVYRGNDGRYYCKRPDGTTGLIAGGLGGAVLGNVIDGGRSRAVGTILGAIGGALAGRAVDRGAQERQGITCR